MFFVFEKVSYDIFDLIFAKQLNEREKPRLSLKEGPKPYNITDLVVISFDLKTTEQHPRNQCHFNVIYL